LLLLALAAPSLAQDPTGRPEGANPKRKRPPAKEKPKLPAEPPTVILTILTSPGQSDVFVNGQKRGATDGDGKLIINKLPLGSYTVEIRKDGFLNSLRGFKAGIESPTLIFKLHPALDPIVKEVAALIEAGKVIGPDSPNALEVYRATFAKFPDQTDVLRMRNMVADKLKLGIEPAIARTLQNWREISREELAKAANETAAMVEVTPGDKYSEAQAIYFNALGELRNWQTGASASNGARAGDAGEEHPGGLARVRAELEKCVAIVDSWAPAWYWLGTVLLTAGEAGPAEAAFVRTAALEPRWAIAHAGLGEAYYAGRKYKEAVASFQKSSEIETRVRSVAGLGLARVAKGETAAGIKDIQRAAAMDSTSGLPHYYLGIVYSTSKKDKELARAIEDLKKAVQLNGSNAEFQNRAAQQLITEIEGRRKKRK
jgi:Flp pilus assembly protein TadD